MPVAQGTAPTIEQLSVSAARGDQEQVGIFRDFLAVANEAHRRATDEQRSLMRQLGATLPTPQEAAAGIRSIMGWD